ncbi:hypothetical protein [Aeoliella sp. SH292]|uniref:hypothetical protein n=1 Tax=Aeoliella sp. SH292 TaxID=3454464 RepID=UPI003F9D2372
MFAKATNLEQASRLGRIVGTRDSINTRELAILFACGVLAAMAVALVTVPLRIPGHAILRAALPMVAGLALVPRRSAGGVMSLGALAAVGVFYFGSIGNLQAAAVTGMLALGPAIDVALRGEPTGWRLYLRLALAGMAANLLAWGVRMTAALLLAGAGSGRGMGGGGGMGMGGGGGGGVAHNFFDFWPMALVTFALCGAIAGLASAAVWFKSRSAPNPRLEAGR